MEKIHEVYIGHSMLIIKNGRIDIRDLEKFGITAKNFNLLNLGILDEITVKMYNDGSEIKINMTENDNEIKVI